MASFAPLRPGDPQRLGGLELQGRLGEGGQGVVYLGKDPAGTHLAVKWLRPDLSGDQVSVERFLREVQVAQQVAPFCTAAVVGTGVEQDRPYIVSEFIEGPSLHKIVQEEGPRTGSVLHRLAIGTATALAAIHQAGIVHRDFKPANVIIGADGPRVIDFGIARALNATATISSMVVGTPAYMAPEQIMGETVGPAADMFSWGSAMVFAACGRAPFGSDTMPAVINRVLNQQPDLDVLDGQLRDVVAACLAKDPAQRPTAEQVIMRLLQRPEPNSGMLAQAAAEAAPSPPFGPPPGPAPHSGPAAYHGHAPHSGPVPHHSGGVPYPGPAQHPGHPGPVPRTGAVAPHPHGQWTPPGPPPQPTYPTHHPPSRRSRGPLIAGAAIAVALLVLAGVVVIIQIDKSTLADPPAKSSRTPSSIRSPRPSATAAAVPRTGTKKALPGADISLYENPADAIVLTSYEVFDKKGDDWVDYARGALHGTFTKYAGNWESMVSPDGRYLATRGRSYSSDNFDFIVITDRDTGERTTIKTVKKPLISSIRAWSNDGGKILLNIERKDGDDWVYPGFVLVDVLGKDSTTVNVSDDSIRQTAFGFDGSYEGTVNVYGDEKNRGLRFFDAEGKATHSVPGIGTLSAGTQDIFSPSGKAFVTNCPNGGDGDHCVWDSATGERLRKFSSDCDKVLGWYDESHLYCWEQDNNANDEVQVVDFNGKLVRKLLEVPDEIDFSPAFTVNPNRGS
ncbi:WD40 repeat domain-containing serine/threonine protein kinase [Nonomuraea jiangxiensis]|uniref:Serine/threonine protein kinase n=1 Tax=Nonomuraea jiangxiensis TaxID=633440 RepID=A0A1G8G235_9ACTN|nr:WD40 repeat domain-containing serine/threonine protein kinase [Nonomuraea jiangxiensis]SDH88432.1 Serine/threonine protein kinase [Nonomuraea jiangxiensis]